MERWIEWLADEVNTDRTGKKVLLAESHKDGRQLMEQLARRGCQVLNLHVLTLQDLLQEALTQWQQHANVEWIESGDVWYWMRNQLKELQQNNQLHYYQDVVRSPGMVSAMSDAVTELRQGLILSDTLPPDSFINTPKYQDLKQILHQWETMLEQEQKADGFRVLQWLKENEEIIEPDTRYFMAPRSPLTRLEEELFITLFHHHQDALLKGPSPEEEPREKDIHLSHSGSSWQEVRDLLRQIKSRRLPLDDCLILLPTKEPYTNYLEALACRYELPITFSHGIQVSSTRPGKLFMLLLQWIQSDYQASICYALLRENLLQIPDGCPPPATIEFYLKKHQIGWGKDRYVDLFTQALEKAKANEEEQAETLEPITKVFQSMMENLPDLQSIEGEEGNWVRRLLHWWKTYARIGDERDAEGKAALEKALEMAARHHTPSLPVAEVLEELGLHAGSLRVGMKESEPGSLHCQGLSHGLFSPRSHVFIPGLSARLFPGSPKDGPILLDRERKRVGTLALAQDKPLLKEQQLSRVLTGSASSLSFSMPAYDPIEHREESPASFLLQMYRLWAEEPSADYQQLRNDLSRDKLMGDILPARRDEILDGWEQKLMVVKGLPQQTEALPFPLDEGLLRGKAAWKKRQEGTFNQYNGLIQVEASEVDPRVNQELVMSASQLEQLAKCPYIHFLQRLLKLWPEEDVVHQPDQWLDALNRGSLLHRVYENYYRQVLEGQPPSEALVLATLEKQVEIFRQAIPIPSQRIFRKEVEELTASCQVFYRSEAINHGNQQPVYLEMNFGMGEPHPDLGAIPPVQIALNEEEGFFFRGSVDRVDQLNEKEYEILDYKTGSTYGFHQGKPFDQGKRLQHALYAQAAEHLLKEFAGEASAQVVKASYYFSTIRGRGEKTTYHQTPALRESMEGLLTSLFNAVAAGAFVDWGSSFDRKWEEYRPILQQNLKGDQMKAFLLAMEEATEDETQNEAIESLLEVLTYE